jgi:hypothetical protein
MCPKVQQDTPSRRRSQRGKPGRLEGGTTVFGDATGGGWAMPGHSDEELRAPPSGRRFRLPVRFTQHPMRRPELPRLAHCSDSPGIGPLRDAARCRDLRDNGTAFRAARRRPEFRPADRRSRPAATGCRRRQSAAPGSGHRGPDPGHPGHADPTRARAGQGTTGQSHPAANADGAAHAADSARYTGSIDCTGGSARTRTRARHRADRAAGGYRRRHLEGRAVRPAAGPGRGQSR